jgi:predicted DNA-binding transcriptional regulator AlpA
MKILRERGAGLAALLQDPARLMEVPMQAIPGLLADLERLRVILWSRMMSPGTNGLPEVPDRLLDIRVAAQKLQVSPDWLYRRAAKLPFTVRLGSRLRFSALGIERYIRQREGRG